MKESRHSGRIGWWCNTKPRISILGSATSSHPTTYMLAGDGKRLYGPLVTPLSTSTAMCQMKGIASEHIWSLRYQEALSVLYVGVVVFPCFFVRWAGIRIGCTTARVVNIAMLR